MDAMSLSQHYAQMAQALRSSMPSTCCFIKPEEVEPVGSRPVAAGGFADIWEATHGGRKVGLKSYRSYMTFDVSRAIERFSTEILVCNLLYNRDVNVVPFVGIYSTETHPFALVYEYMDGLDLKQYLRNEPKARRLKLLTDIAHSLSRMYDLGIIHRNIQAANILVDKDGTPRIAGLGSLSILPHSTAWGVENGVDIDRLGPSHLELAGLGLSPNVTVSTQPTDLSDMYYAFGVMAFEVLTGDPPFCELTEIAATYSMMTGHRPPRPNYHEISDRLWYMVERSWHVIPSQRMPIGEAAHLLEAELRRTSES